MSEVSGLFTVKERACPSLPSFLSSHWLKWRSESRSRHRHLNLCDRSCPLITLQQQERRTQSPWLLWSCHNKQRCLSSFYVREKWTSILFKPLDSRPPFTAAYLIKCIRTQPGRLNDLNGLKCCWSSKEGRKYGHINPKLVSLVTILDHFLEWINKKDVGGSL